MPPAAGKHRILCLHGYMQNAEVFRNRIGSMRKGLKSQAEFVFVDAPYMAATDEEAAREAGGTASSGRTWWQWTDIAPGTRPATAAHYTGWEASQAAIADALAEHAPVHGLLGFSQGACAAALYAGGAVRDPTLPRPSYLVLIGGFLPRDASWARRLVDAAPISIPSLHVFGAADALVPPSRSRELVLSFPPDLASVHEHPGAHMVPTCTGAFRDELREYLTRMDGCLAQLGAT